MSLCEYFHVLVHINHGFWIFFRRKQFSWNLRHFSVTELLPIWDVSERFIFHVHMHFCCTFFGGFIYVFSWMDLSYLMLYIFLAARLPWLVSWGTDSASCFIYTDVKFVDIWFLEYKHPSIYSVLWCEICLCRCMTNIYAQRLFQLFILVSPCWGWWVVYIRYSLVYSN